MPEKESKIQIRILVPINLGEKRFIPSNRFTNRLSICYPNPETFPLSSRSIPSTRIGEPHSGSNSKHILYTFASFADSLQNQHYTKTLLCSTRPTKSARVFRFRIPIFRDLPNFLLVQIPRFSPFAGLFEFKAIFQLLPTIVHDFLLQNSVHHIRLI